MSTHAQPDPANRSAIQPDAAVPLRAGGVGIEKDGRFVDWRFIGAGGVADVFRVQDRLLGIDLAIKILRQDAPSGRQAMLNEVLVSRALRHPFICPVHDVYAGPHGFGVVMDVLEGCDLKAWIQENAGHLHATFPARLALIEKLADALSVAHRRIIHRDIKPANIFLIDGDIEQPLIMDFGLSLLDKPALQGSKAGTPAYMAPEQHIGQTDAKSDIFALGVIAYQLLTDGRHPLGRPARRPTAEDWERARIAPPSEFCGLTNSAHDRLILQMLRANPTERPTSAREIVGALRAAATAADKSMDAANQPTYETIAVPEGTYVIGSPPNAPYVSEKPMRRIRLSAFRIGARPVTNADYLSFCRATGAPPPPLIEDPVFGRGDHPAVMLDWSEAAACAAYMGGRLPTEAEWEAAARSGPGLHVFPWGDDPIAPERANADGTVGATTAVGSYPLGATDRGLQDMAGNVWEWCADVYDERAYRMIRDGAADPRAPEPSAGLDPATVERVVRGGAFDSLPAMCRNAFRHRAAASAKRRNIGFRVVMDAHEE